MNRQMVARGIAAAAFAIALPLSASGSGSSEPSGGAAQRSTTTAGSRQVTETGAPAPDSSVKAAQAARPCRWWQFRRCEDRTDAGPDVEGLPDGAPRSGTIITVDLSTNTLYLFQNGELVTKSPAATGSGKVLANGDDIWSFETPRGHMKVLRKIVDPVWKKPDWAFIEDGKRVPKSNDPSRYVKGHLGKYALALGDGIMIHGTDDPDSIGLKVSHGCIRLPAKALATVYKAAKVGTDVYIYQSEPPQTQASSSSGPEHHSDLDYLAKKGAQQ